MNQKRNAYTKRGEIIDDQSPKMASSGAAKNRKKANLVDHYSIKHLLDESVTEVASLPSFNSFPPRWTSRVLLVGDGLSLVQVVKSRGYAEDVRLSNVRLLIGSIIIAIALLAQLYPKKFPENREFLITCIGLYPFTLCLDLFGQFGHKNRITIVYKGCLDYWFTKDGLLVEGLFWKDVERLMDDYNGDRKNK
ncbi:hypothetical protein BHM03_00056972 [Ensete ventricosum]|nr:hypothetical protein BHM03_00056972 [Ensete ventricosum]